jgi:hypothetical protein
MGHGRPERAAEQLHLLIEGTLVMGATQDSHHPGRASRDLAASIRSPVLRAMASPSGRKPTLVRAAQRVGPTESGWLILTEPFFSVMVQVTRDTAGRWPSEVRFGKTQSTQAQDESRRPHR